MSGTKELMLGNVTAKLSLEEAKSLLKMFKSRGYKVFCKINQEFLAQELETILGHIGGDVGDLHSIQAINLALKWKDSVETDIEDALEEWKDDDVSKDV